MNKMIRTSLLGFFLLALAACQSSTKKDAPVETNPFAKYTECKDPRPEVCTKEYNPVCAQKDTGIRCVTTPCPSTEDVTYSTACTACSDSAVNGYKMGACK